MFYVHKESGVTGRTKEETCIHDDDNHLIFVDDDFENMGLYKLYNQQLYFVWEPTDGTAVTLFESTIDMGIPPEDE